jgi:hypothetical protein
MMGNRVMTKATRIAALLGFMLTASTTLRAVDIQELVRETQRTTTTDGQVGMVWWIPVQFWEESLNANPAVPPEARSQVLGALSDYTVIGVLRAGAGLGGLTNVIPKEELVKNLRVELDGKVVEPLAPEKVSSTAQLLLLQMKPALGAIIGQVGQSLEFVVYPAKENGKALIDPTQSGNLTVTFYGQSQKWRLPLASLLPKRKDPKTGEEFPGSYNFNPYTGAKLPAK